MNKRCYFVECKWADVGVSVIASSAKEAKKIAFNGYLAQYDAEWIQLRVEWQKKVTDIEDLPIGYIFDEEEQMMDGLYRGAYAWIEYATCPNCGTEDTRVHEIYDNVFGCDNCEDKLTPKDINNPRLKQDGSKQNALK